MRNFLRNYDASRIAPSPCSPVGKAVDGSAEHQRTLKRSAFGAVAISDPSMGLSMGRSPRVSYATATACATQADVLGPASGLRTRPLHVGL